MKHGTEQEEVERSRIEALVLKDEDLTLKPENLAKYGPPPAGCY